MKLTITLTLAEANAIWRAAGNSLGCELDALAILHDRRSMNAAQRAHLKIMDAILEATKPKSRKVGAV